MVRGGRRSSAPFCSAAAHRPLVQPRVIVPPSRLARLVACVATSVATCVAALASCAPPAATPPARPAPTADVPLRDRLAAPWEIGAALGGVSQRLVLHTELESRVDTVVRRDSSALHLAFSWTRLSGTASERLSGLITAARLGDTDSTALPPSDQLFPIPLVATRSAGGGAETSSPDLAACSAAAALLSPIREALFFPPRRLTPGLTWTDSSSVTVCRDSIPLTVTTQRQYRVVGAELLRDEVVVRVDRETRVRMQGQGRQFGEPIEIAADGEGTSTLLVRLAGAYLLQGTGSQELRMTMRGRRRTQTLVQRTRLDLSSDSSATP